MSYSRRTVTDGVTVMNKDLYDNLQDGIDELKTNPVISGSFSMNRKSGTTIGSNSTAEGSNCTASGSSSHAEGYNTISSGYASHSSGSNTEAKGDNQFVIGKYNKTNTTSAFIIGNGSSGNLSNAMSVDFNGNADFSGDVTATDSEGIQVSLTNDKMNKNNPTGTGSFSMNRLEGSTIGENSVALGSDNVSSNNSFAIGQKCVSGSYIEYDTTVISEIENNNTIHYFKILDLSNTISVNDEIILVGLNNITSDVSLFKSNILSISETTDSENNTFYKLKIDESKINFDDYEYGLVFIFDTSKENTISSYAEGYFTSSNGMFSHSEGYFTSSNGMFSHSEGYSTTASSQASHAEGVSTTASGASSHAEGDNTTASNQASHAEGRGTTASRYASHAEGGDTKADGDYAHAEGYKTTASGYASHSEGEYTKASGKYAHAEGYHTTARSNNQHVQGKYNIEDTTSTYAHIVGGGTSNTDKKNIHTLDWNGNAVFSGDVTATKSDGTEVSLLSLKSTLDSIQVQNFYTGIGAPSNTLGEDGDLYLIT